MKNDLVVYTAIFGGKDKLIKQPCRIPRCRYVCFTDSHVTDSLGWEIRKVDVKDDHDPIRQSRYYKMMSHELFPQAKWTIWIDATMQIVGNLLPLVDQAQQDFRVFAHPDWNCVYREIAECRRLRKDSQQALKELKRRYHQAGMPHGLPLAACTVLVRKNTEAVRRFNEAWWEEYCNCGSLRDQPAFTYLCWKMGFKYDVISGDMRRNQYFVHHKRKKERSVNASNPTIRSSCEVAVRNSCEVAVIIPVYNHFDYAINTVRSVLSTTEGLVFVLDDASPGWKDGETGERFAELELNPDVPRIRPCHLTVNAGLSKTWNMGLQLCRDARIKYAVCTNSDVIFTVGWWGHIKTALEDYDFVGPMTNAPGHCKQQDVTQLFPDYKPSDDSESLLHAAGELDRAYKEEVIAPDNLKLNGFCIAARTETWFDCAFDQDNVFNPTIRDRGGEDDLMKRAVHGGKKLGIAKAAYVFHYRGVTLGLHSTVLDRGAYRSSRPMQILRLP